MVLTEMQFISLLLKPDENLHCIVKANIPGVSQRLCKPLN